MGKKIASGKKIVGKRVSGEIHTLQKHGIDKGDNMLLADVYGVGNVLTERLAKAGFLTVGDVRKNPEKALEVEGFGPQKLAVLGIKVPKKQKSVKKQKMEVKTEEKTTPKKSGENTKKNITIDEILEKRDSSFYNVPTFFTRKIKEAGYKPDKIAQDTPHALRIYIKAPDGNLAHAVWDKDRGVFFIRELRDGETKTTFKIEGLPKYNKTLDLGQSKMDTSKDALVKKLEQDEKFAVTVERKSYGKWREYTKYPRVWVSNDHTKIRVYIPKSLRGGREGTEGYVGVDIDNIDNIQIAPDKYGDEEVLKEYAEAHSEDLKRLARIYKVEVDALRMDGVKRVIDHYKRALRGPETDKTGMVKLEGEKFMGWDVKSGRSYVYSINRHPNGKVTITAHLITDKQLSREDFKEMMAIRNTEKSKMVPPNYSRLKQYGVTDFSIVIMSNDEKDAENLLQKKIDIIKKYE